MPASRLYRFTFASLALFCSAALLPPPAAWSQDRGGWNGQPAGQPGGQPGGSRYGAASGNTLAPIGAAPAAASPVTPIGPAGSGVTGGMTAVGGGAAPSRARVTKGSGALPRDHGQVWREYDIRPYTLRMADTEHPEQRIVDWVLRETGYEAWHSDPLGLLSANRETLRVYHTPEMQQVVAGIIDRFVNSAAKQRAFTLRIATVRSPSWRAKAVTLMTPIPVQSPGVQAWIMPKENAAILLADLGKRGDYREHAASNQLVLNGHKLNVSTMRPRQYIKGVVRTPNAWPGFQPETGTLEEGASLEFSPLLSLDTATADAVVKIRINQVEKMTPVTLDIPTQLSGNQRMEVEAPQLTMAHVHERFRWPADQVLLLSLGVVPPPTPDKGAGGVIMSMLPGGSDPPRADGLLMIDVKGTTIPGATPGAAPVSTALQPGAFSGRY
ncbi:MAG: hypothetical protein AAF596_07845 [Planctomycetota bacterium]